LDGIERFLQRQPYRNPTLQEESRNIGLESKRKIAQYILENKLLDELEKYVDEDIIDYQHMINLKKMSIVWQTKQVRSDINVNPDIFIPKRVENNPPLARHLFSLAEVCNNSTQIQTTDVQNIPILKFHFSVTLLSIYGQSGDKDTNRDPLFSIMPSTSGSNFDNILNSIIRWWMADSTEMENSNNIENSNDTNLWNGIGKHVINIFIELVGDNLYSLLQQHPRSKISQKLLFCTSCERNSTSDIRYIIPVPAKIDILGIVGYCECPSKKQRKVFLCKMPDDDSFNTVKNNFTPSALTWETTPNGTNNNLDRHYASLNSWKLLNKKLPEDINRSQWIVKVFRALADIYK
jgi:hypothetical protein